MRINFKYILYVNFFLLLYKYNFLVMIFFHYIFLILYNIFFISNWFDIICTDLNGIIMNIIFRIKGENSNELAFMSYETDPVQENENYLETNISTTLHMKNINKAASFVGKKLTPSETVKLSMLPPINKLHSNVHFSLIESAINDKLINIPKLFNPDNLDIDSYRRVCTVSNYFYHNAADVLYSNICNKVLFNCDLINLQHPDLVKCMPWHIFSGLDEHPAIYCKLDNDLSLICPTTHRSPYAESTLIGKDPKDGKKMYAIPFFVELETNFCKEIVVTPGSDIINAYANYEDNIKKHVLYTYNNRINVSKIYLCNRSLYVPYELCKVSSHDIDKYIVDSAIVLDNKTKYEIDHIKEKLTIKINDN